MPHLGAANARPPVTTSVQRPAGAGAPGLVPAWPVSTQQAVQLNLARALAASGAHCAATEAAARLGFAGAEGAARLAGSCPEAALALAAAQAGAGEAAQAAASLSAVLAATGGGGGSCSGVPLAEVSALTAVQLAAKQYDDCFAVLLQWAEPAAAAAAGGKLEAGDAASASAATGVAWLWLALASAAAEGGQRELAASAREALWGWASGLPGDVVDTAALRAQLLAGRAAERAEQGGGSSASHAAALPEAAAAVHLCPWAPALRVQLAGHVAASGPQRAAAALRLCPTPAAVQRAAAAPPALSGGARARLSAPAGAAAAGGDALVAAAAATRAHALLSLPAAVSVEAAGGEQLRLRQLLHSYPSSPLLWYLAALVAYQAALGSQRCCDFVRAGACCRGALAVLRRHRALNQQRQQPPRPGAGLAAAFLGAAAPAASPLDCLPAQHLDSCIVRLLAAASECALHSRAPDAADSAHEKAMEAMSTAVQAGAGTATAHRQVGLGCCAACLPASGRPPARLAASPPAHPPARLAARPPGHPPGRPSSCPPPCPQMVRMLLWAGLHDQAEAAYRQAAGTGDGVAALELAHLLARTGRRADAVALLQQQQAAPGSDGGGGVFGASCQLEAARLLLIEGRADEARQAVAGALAGQPACLIGEA